MGTTNYVLDTCRLFTAPNITDPLSDWYDFGETRGSINLEINQEDLVAKGRVDQKGVSSLAEYVRKHPAAMAVNFPVLKSDIDSITKVLPKSVKVTSTTKDALGFSGNPSAVTPVAVAMVPVDEIVEGEPWWLSENAVFIPNAIITIDGSKTFKLAEGDDILGDVAYMARVHSFTSTAESRQFIGKPWALPTNPVDVVGFGDTNDFDYVAPDSVLRTALNNLEITTPRQFCDKTSLEVYNISSDADITDFLIQLAIDSTSIDLTPDLQTVLRQAIGTTTDPVAITGNSDSIFVGTTANNNITKIDLSDLSTSTIVTVGEVSALGITSSYLWVVGETANTVRVYNLSDDSLNTSIAISGTQPKSIDFDATHAYVVSRGGSEISKIEISSLTEVDTELVSGDPRFGVISGTHLIVFEAFNDYVEKYTLSSLSFVSRYTAGFNVGSQGAVDSGFCYFVDADSNLVVKLQVSDMTLVKKIDVDLSNPRFFKINNGHLWSIDQVNSQISVYDLTNERVVAKFSTSLNSPQRMFFQGAYAYITNNGTDQVLQMETPNYTGSIPTLEFNTKLTSVDFSGNALTGFDGGTIPNALVSLDFSDNALASEAVNLILRGIVLGGASGGTVNLSGGTNGEPTGQGITDVATLTSNGWTVTTN